MANEYIIRWYETGVTIYVCKINEAGQWWNGSSYETFTVANWANYKIALTETPAGSYLYVGDEPDTTDGYVIGFKQEGGSPAITDSMITNPESDIDLFDMDDNIDAIKEDTETTIPGTLSTMEGKIDIIDGIVDSILVDTGTTLPATLATMEGKINTIDGIVDNIILDTNELQTDDVPGLIAALNNLSSSDVNTQVVAALVAYHLDHLFAAEYDPDNKPGAATALLNEIMESDSGVSRFTQNSLEQAPTGGGGDATEAKQDTIIANLATVDTNVDSVLADTAFMDKLLQADMKIITTETPWQLHFLEKGTSTILMKKELYQPDGTNVTETNHIIGQHIHTT